MATQYQHLISFRLTDAMMAQLDNQSNSINATYSDTIRLALTLLFSKQLRNTRNTANMGVR